MAFFIFTPSNSTWSISHALDLSALPFCLILLPPFSTSWRSFSTFQDSRDYIRLPFLLSPSYNLSFLKSTVPFYIAQSQEWYFLIFIGSGDLGAWYLGATCKNSACHAIHSWFMPEWYITRMGSKWWCTSLSFLLCFSWCITIRKGFLPLTKIISIIYFNAHMDQYWLVVTPSVWLLLTSSQVFIILERFLSALTRCSMFTLHCPLPSPGISYFSKEFWFLLVGCSIWKAKSGCMMCPLPAGCLVLPGSFTEKANIRVIFSWVDIETFNSNLIPQTSF